MKKQIECVLRAFTISIFIVELSGQAATPKKNSSPLPADTHAVTAPKESTLPPNKCGILVPCIGTDKVFMYFCTGDEVTIRHCGEESKWSPEGITHTEADGKPGSCVGEEKTLSRASFIAYMKSQLDSAKASGGKVGNLTKDEIAALKSEGKVTALEKQCGDLEGQINNLRLKLAKVTTLSPEGKAAIEAKITKLEGTLGPAKTELDICQNKQEAIKKIDKEISDAVSTICSGGIHVPEQNTFLHAVLSQFKYPCGTEVGLTVAQRAEKCGDVPKRLSSGQTFTLVSRYLDKDGKVQEYLRDDVSGFVWGPEANPEDIKKIQAEKGLVFEYGNKENPDYYSAAIEYCKSKKDLGLKWHLPTRAEFLQAGYKDNVDKEFSYNQYLPQVIDTNNKWFWSSTPWGSSSAWGFNGDINRTDAGMRYSTDTVRCVGQ
jgi:hypothetical protein